MARTSTRLAIEADPALRAFSYCLADANKESKVIIVAVVRKMITTLNAMLSDNATWSLIGLSPRSRARAEVASYVVQVGAGPAATETR